MAARLEAKVRELDLEEGDTCDKKNKLEIMRLLLDINSCCPVRPSKKGFPSRVYTRLSSRPFMRDPKDRMNFFHFDLETGEWSIVTENDKMYYRLDYPTYIGPQLVRLGQDISGRLSQIYSETVGKLRRSEDDEPWEPILPLSSCLLAEPEDYNNTNTVLGMILTEVHPGWSAETGGGDPANYARHSVQSTAKYHILRDYADDSVGKHLALAQMNQRLRHKKGSAHYYEQPLTAESKTWAATHRMPVFEKDMMPH